MKKYTKITKQCINKYILYLLLLLVIVSIFIFTFLFSNRKKNEYFILDVQNSSDILISNGNPNTNTIPKIIWTFWNEEKLPYIIDSCINSWKKHNPEFEINILNTTNYNAYLPDLNISDQKNLSDSFARKSDVIRLNILRKYGGTWLDASIICNASLQWILDLQQKYKVECVAYYLKKFTDQSFIKTSPVIESWFISCTSQSQFIADWCNEFMSINNYNSVDHYIYHTVNAGTSVQHIDIPNYLAIHVAAQKIVQQPNNYNLYLLRAEDEPYLFLDNNFSEFSESIPKLASGIYNHLKIIKLTGDHRKYFIEHNIPIDKLFI